jgi:hypothetical protein
VLAGPTQERCSWRCRTADQARRQLSVTYSATKALDRLGLKPLANPPLPPTA